MVTRKLALAARRLLVTLLAAALLCALQAADAHFGPPGRSFSAVTRAS